jgi:3',5'-cyclic AMP phosphodiesterase CpdA
MPGVFHQPVRRRDFLTTSLLTGAAVAASFAAPAADEIHLALLSDPHVGPGELAKDPRGFDPCEQLRRVVPEIIQGSPRGVILNGDAASREGLIVDYQELKTLLDPLSRVSPIYIGLGNHDHPGNFGTVFPSSPGIDAEVPNHHVVIVEESFMQFIVLDSLLYVNKAAGLLGERQRAWLADYLPRHPERTTILFVHHSLGDGDGELLDGNRLFEIIRPHRQVKAIFYGHSHAWNLSERQGVKLINLPSLGYNFTQTEPVGWVDARFRPDGVDLTLHAIAGNRAQDGQVSWISWT